jgi:hypothetical protein
MGKWVMPIDYRMMTSAAHVLTEDGRSLGTGFCVTVASEVPNTDRYGYLVTAYHNVHGLTTFQVAFSNANGNGELYEPFPIYNWVQPLIGVDIAVAPLDGTRGRNIMGILIEHMLPIGDVIYPNLGSPLYYIGRFSPAKRMVARSGNVAALEQFGLSKELDDADADLEYADYPIHLVDCRSYDGFSGSPCFVLMQYPGLLAEPLPEDFPGAPGPDIPLGRMLYAAIPCGMFIAHYSDEGQVVRNPGGVVSRYGMGMMVRGNEIKAAVMTQGFVKARKESDDIRRANEPKLVKPVAAPKEASALDRTADLLHDLTRPKVKEEADEIHKGHQ